MRRSLQLEEIYFSDPKPQMAAGENPLFVNEGLVLEIELWRADMMTGLVHLDPKTGLITRTSDLPIYQPGEREKERATDRGQQ